MAYKMVTIHPGICREDEIIANEMYERARKDASYTIHHLLVSNNFEFNKVLLYLEEKINNRASNLSLRVLIWELQKYMSDHDIGTIKYTELPNQFNVNLMQVTFLCH